MLRLFYTTALILTLTVSAMGVSVLSGECDGDMASKSDAAKGISFETNCCCQWIFLHVDQRAIPSRSSTIKPVLSAISAPILIAAPMAKTQNVNSSLREFSDLSPPATHSVLRI